MSLQMFLEKLERRWSVHIFPSPPPWMIKDPQPLPQGHPSYLCENCRRYNFDWLLSNDLDRTYARMRAENKRVFTEIMTRVGEASKKEISNPLGQAERDKLDVQLGGVIQVQNHEEIYNAAQKMLDRQYCGNLSASGRSSETPGPRQITHNYGRGYWVVVDTGLQEECTAAERRTAIHEAFLKNRNTGPERANWGALNYLDGYSNDIRLDSSSKATEEQHGKETPESSQMFPKVTLSLCSVAELLANQECALCRLVVRSICTKYDLGADDVYNDQYLDNLSDMGALELQAIDPKHGCFITSENRGRLSKLELFDVKISVHPGGMIKGCPNKVEAFPFQQIQEDSVVSHVGRIITEMVDYEIVKLWMRNCSEQEPVDPPKGFQLIDVRQRCVVEMRHHCRYFALSYVWGDTPVIQNTRETREQFSKPFSLYRYHSRIPQTILDAMLLLFNIGEQYLWVDSLCITQDDAQLKHDQISSMDVVYHSAFAVIVAAHGDSACAGLPGIMPGSRHWKQHIETVQGIKLANSHDPPSIMGTAYNQRAWTYQELVLARRALVFTTDTMWFRCEHGIWEEDRYEDFEYRDSADLSGPYRELMESRYHDYKLNFQRYALAVKRYTKRKLSYEADALNAFTGILHNLEPAFRGGFVHGLPSTELDLALLWTPLSNLDLRTIRTRSAEVYLPTWSWIAWDGPVAWTFPPTLAEVWQYRVHSRVRWIDPLCGNSFTSGQYRGSDAHKQTQWRKINLGRFNTDIEMNVLASEDSETLFLHAIEKEEDRVPRTIVAPKDMNLMFDAQVAELLVTHQLAVDSSFRGESCHDFKSPTACCTVPIITEDGYHAGYIRAPHLVYQLGQEKDNEDVDGWTHVISDQGCAVSLVALSRTHGVFELTPENREIARHEAERPPPHDDGDAEFCKPSVLPDCLQSPEESHELFDERRFKPKPWCIYNVMMIGRIGWGRSVRLGVGACHVDAFQQAQPKLERVILI